ncbi:MAG: hypothetical protein AAF206_29005, partial [Bacteroidota bacterium]
MKRLKHVYLLMAMFLVSILSCEKPEALTDVALEQTDQLEPQLVQEPEITLQKSCDDCSPSPGGISKYSSALGHSVYEFGDASKSKKWSKSSTTCYKVDSNGNQSNSGNYVYNTCGDWLVMQSQGGSSDRSELKMDKSVKLDDQ